MKRVMALILVGLLVAPPVRAEERTGKSIAWDQLRQYEAGQEIVVARNGGSPAKLRLLFADNASVFTLDPSLKLPGGVTQVLLGVRANWPAVFDGTHAVKDGAVGLSKDGVFDGSKKIGDLADVVQRTWREDVQGMWQTKGRSRIWLIPVLGAAAALVSVLVYYFALCANEGC